MKGYYEVVALLLKDPRGRAEPCGPKAVDPSISYQCPIRWASENGHHKVVKRSKSSEIIPRRGIIRRPFGLRSIR